MVMKVREFEGIESGEHEVFDGAAAARMKSGDGAGEE